MCRETRAGGGHGECFPRDLPWHQSCPNSKAMGAAMAIFLPSCAYVAGIRPFRFLRPMTGAAQESLCCAGSYKDYGGFAYMDVSGSGPAYCREKFSAYKIRDKEDPCFWVLG